MTQNDTGEFLDLYEPQKCSASDPIVGARDHESILMNVAEVEQMMGRFNTFAICGDIDRMGDSDNSILQLTKADGIFSKKFYRRDEE
uniref:Uncharacterized protein n=1 Tax=Sciurus vulgaris TaxID=55149 RepID=A0A8D2D468_SCIVU